MILLFFLSFKKIQILVGNCWRLKSLPFYKLPHCGVRIHFANFKSNSIYNYKSLIGILWIMQYRSLKNFLKNWKPNMSPVYRFLCDCIVCSMQSQNVFFPNLKNSKKFELSLHWELRTTAQTTPKWSENDILKQCVFLGIGILTKWKWVMKKYEKTSRSYFWILSIDVVENQNSEHRIVPIILDTSNIKIWNISSDFEM